MYRRSGMSCWLRRTLKKPTWTRQTWFSLSTLRKSSSSLWIQLLIAQLHTSGHSLSPLSTFIICTVHSPNHAYMLNWCMGALKILLLGGSVVGQIANTFAPLYFTVTEHREVMSTEQPCDLSYVFGDEYLSLLSYPQQFPKPAKHPYPFDDQAVINIRRIGPGVLVGQAWQEGRELQQVPRKLCGDILMVREYSAT